MVRGDGVCKAADNAKAVYRSVDGKKGDETVHQLVQPHLYKVWVSSSTLPGACLGPARPGFEACVAYVEEPPSAGVPAIVRALEACLRGSRPAARLRLRWRRLGKKFWDTFEVREFIRHTVSAG